MDHFRRLPEREAGTGPAATALDKPIEGAKDNRFPPRSGPQQQDQRRSVHFVIHPGRQSATAMSTSPLDHIETLAENIDRLERQVAVWAAHRNREEADIRLHSDDRAQVEAATSRAAVKLLAMAAVMIIDPLTDSAAEDARQRILDLSARTPRYRTGFQLCDLMATRLRETRDKAVGRIH